MTALGTEPGKAIEFLQALRPGGPWAITAIVPDGETLTRSFTAQQTAQLSAFIAEHNATKNIYYTVNQLKGRVGKKPKKSDIATAEFLHIDADPDAAESPETFKTRLLPLLRSYQLPPTFIIDSGNGLHGLWRLEAPVVLNGGAEIEDIEARNYSLAVKFGAPPVTRNIDRLLRLPGTINWPNAVKRRHGRQPCQASLIASDNVTCSLASVARFEEPKKGRTEPPPSDRPRKRLPSALRNMLYLSGNSPAGYPSRSELLWAFLTEALRLDIDDNDLVSACLDETYDGAIFQHCAEKGGEAYVRTQIEKAIKAIGTNTDIAPQFSEEAIALTFTKKHGTELRHVARWGRWLFWDGTRWQFDEKRRVFSLARTICRETAATINAPKLARTVASAKTRAAVISLASDDRQIAASIEQWDADVWLLNTPAGVLDLRTGETRPAGREDYMTKITAVGCGGDCPLWLSFLDKVANHDADLQQFLQRFCGYALTGDTSVDAICFLHGKGGNGKTVFINTISGVMGDYHKTTAIETFTASMSDRHPTELASLMGARLVTATETEEGRRWAESRLKQLTGGEGKVSARFMRQDFFEYTPQFKLMIAGNHKPGLRSVDVAIRRRMNLIPFSVIIPPNEVDDRLEEKLKAEWPGILRWMIDGCLAWQKTGMTRPQCVKDATDKYLEDEDTFHRWLEECCRIDKAEWAAFGDLFACWKSWTEAMGEYTGSSKAFSQRLEEDGRFTPRPGGQKGRPGMIGLSLYVPSGAGEPRRMIWEKPW